MLNFFDLSVKIVNRMTRCPFVPLVLIDTLIIYMMGGVI